MEQQTELLKSSDIKSSAYLLNEGVPLVKLVSGDQNKTLFCFPATESVRDPLQKYWTNRATTNPRQLFENFDYLKGLIHGDYGI